MGANDQAAQRVAKRDAELDALRVERNAAIAEAKMWLRRMLKTQTERDQAKAGLYECDKCLGEWQAAYDELLTQFRRLEIKHQHVAYEAENANWLLSHLDPFLPRWLQTERTAANEMLYEQLAYCRADDALAEAQLQRLADEAPESP